MNFGKYFLPHPKVSRHVKFNSHSLKPNKSTTYAFDLNQVYDQLGRYKKINLKKKNSMKTDPSKKELSISEEVKLKTDILLSLIGTKTFN